VQDGILEMFREKLLPLAAIVTPNQFELGLLTGVDLSRPAGSKGALNAALDAVHKSGPKTVLVTSLRRPRGGEIGMLVSESGGIWEVSTPEFAFTQSIAGGGDLTAAVFLARFLETKNARLALEQTASSVFGIMEATYKSGQRELRTIAAQEELAAPSRHFTSKRFVAG
jgi:pyridoxine kinase